jgi:23S rRNA pseudouridine955/2504/2580 synthase
MDRPALEHNITEDEAGQRLDRWLRKLLPQMPLGAIFRHMRAGRIRVDGAKGKQDLRLQKGMLVRMELPKADLEAVIQAPPQRAPLRASVAFRGVEPEIVFRDEHVLVINKPAGMRSQPGTGAGGRDIVSWLDSRKIGRRSSTFAPAPAHRLDRGTSGLVAIGLSPAGLRGLSAAFREDRAHKIYLAVVHGIPKPGQGSIDAPLLEVLGAKATEPKVVVDPSGKSSRTDYEVTRSRGDRALLRLTLHSGRMHQIRAHLAHLGHPIMGDVRYGAKERLGDGFLLHATELSLPHPITGVLLTFRVEVPASFVRSC